MARGGKRENAGRRKGAQNKITRELVRQVEESGVTPLEYMLSVLRDVSALPTRRDDMAKAAAPYVHSRMPQNLNLGGQKDNPIITTQADKEILDQYYKTTRREK
jgi:hypothetical protein